MARSFISSPQTYEGDTDQAVYAGLGHAAQRNAKFTGYLQPELNAERRVGGPPKVRRVEPPKSSPHYVNYLTIANPVRCYRVAKMETGDARIEQISPAHSKAAQSGRAPPRWNNCNRLACLLRPGGWSGDFIADRIARTRDCVPISSSTSENQVCCFIALCEERSFNRAAICCGLAQSFLARAIHKLERDLGGRIFERRNSNIRLTVLGIWCGQIFCASVRLPELRISADSTDFSERFREEPPVWTGWNSQDS